MGGGTIAELPPLGSFQRCLGVLLDVAVGVVVEGALAFGGAEIIRGVVVVGEEAGVVGFYLGLADQVGLHRFSLAMEMSNLGLDSVRACVYIKPCG